MPVPYQYAEIRVQRGEADVLTGLAPAYVFRLPTAEGPGHVSECKISYSQDETAFAGNLVFEVPGLTEDLVEAIKGAGYVQMLAGYKNLRGREPRTIFFGKIDYVSPRFEAGKVRDTFACKSAFMDLFNVQFALSGSTRASSGTSAIRYLVADAFEDIGKILGLRIVYPRYAKGDLSQLGLPADQEFLDLISIPDYATKATALKHLENLIGTLKNAFKKRFGQDRRIVFSTEGQDMTLTGTRILIADLDLSENYAFLDLRLDNPSIMSAGPVFSTGQTTEDVGDQTETTTFTAAEFSLVSAFNPDVVPHAIVRAVSDQRRSLWVWTPVQIQHEFPVAGEWRTQASGPIQRPQETT